VDPEANAVGDHGYKAESADLGAGRVELLPQGRDAWVEFGKGEPGCDVAGAVPVPGIHGDLHCALDDGVILIATLDERDRRTSARCAEVSHMLARVMVVSR